MSLLLRPLGILKSGDMPPIQGLPGHHHVALGSPGVRDVALLQYDHGFPDMLMEEVYLHYDYIIEGTCIQKSVYIKFPCHHFSHNKYGETKTIAHISIKWTGLGLPFDIFGLIFFGFLLYFLIMWCRLHRCLLKCAHLVPSNCIFLIIYGGCIINCPILTYIICEESIEYKSFTSFIIYLVILTILCQWTYFPHYELFFFFIMLKPILHNRSTAFEHIFISLYHSINFICIFCYFNIWWNL